MSEDNRLKLIIIGIVLIVIAAGYFIFSRINRISDSQVVKQTTSPSPIVVVMTSPSPFVSPSPSPSPSSDVVGIQTKGGIETKGGAQVYNKPQNLPATGFPMGLLAVFGASAAVSGFFLRKFPR